MFVMMRWIVSTWIFLISSTLLVTGEKYGDVCPNENPFIKMDHGNQEYNGHACSQTDKLHCTSVIIKKPSNVNVKTIMVSCKKRPSTLLLGLSDISSITCHGLALIQDESTSDGEKGYFLTNENFIKRNAPFTKKSLYGYIMQIIEIFNLRVVLMVSVVFGTAMIFPIFPQTAWFHFYCLVIFSVTNWYWELDKYFFFYFR